MIINKNRDQIRKEYDYNFERILKFNATKSKLRTELKESTKKFNLYNDENSHILKVQENSQFARKLLADSNEYLKKDFVIGKSTGDSKKISDTISLLDAFLGLINDICKRLPQLISEQQKISNSNQNRINYLNLVLKRLVNKNNEYMSFLNDTELSYFPEEEYYDVLDEFLK